MKYVIDEKIAKDKGLDLPSVLAIMLVKTCEDIPKLFSNLKEREVLGKDMFSFYVTPRWDDVMADILLTSDEIVPKDDELDILTKELMEIFPSGKKDGTSTYWRGNKKDIKLRLKKFFKLYGNKFTFDQIKEATKRYVNSFNGDYMYMRVLKYFIWKDVKKTDGEGRGFIEEVSDLASYIENEGSDDGNSDWTSTLK